VLIFGKWGSRPPGNVQGISVPGIRRKLLVFMKTAHFRVQEAKSVISRGPRSHKERAGNIRPETLKRPFRGWRLPNHDFSLNLQISRPGGEICDSGVPIPDSGIRSRFFKNRCSGDEISRFQKLDIIKYEFHFSFESSVPSNRNRTKVTFIKMTLSFNKFSCYD